MSEYKAERKTVSVTGKASLGWHLGRGYVQEELTVKSNRWVVSNSKRRTVAICQSEAMAIRLADLLNGEHHQ